jgi:hypothetical protein
MMRAPVKKRREVPTTARGDAMGTARGAARNVENRQGKNR